VRRAGILQPIEFEVGGVRVVCGESSAAAGGGLCAVCNARTPIRASGSAPARKRGFSRASGLEKPRALAGARATPRCKVLQESSPDRNPRACSGESTRFDTRLACPMPNTALSGYVMWHLCVSDVRFQNRSASGVDARTRARRLALLGNRVLFHGSLRHIQLGTHPGATGLHDRQSAFGPRAGARRPRIRL